MSTASAPSATPHASATPDRAALTQPEDPRLLAHFRALGVPSPTPLPQFSKTHNACEAWRADPNTMTPWVFVSLDTLPTRGAPNAMETALRDASPSHAYLLWLVSTDGRERLIIDLGDQDGRWEQDGAKGRRMAHLRELRGALTTTHPHPIRLAHAAALLARKDVTHRFYRDMEHAVSKIAAGWTTHASISNDERRELALTLVARAMFLHFVQSKNWLPHPHYLVEICHMQADSLYRTYWRPLCFDALNLAPDARISGVIPPEVPYLNGGLFAPTELEQRISDLDLPNAVLQDLIGEVFTQYAFVDDEHDGSPQAVAPSLLGEIFERLMNPARRQRTGSFYTPPTLATEVWRRAFFPVLNEKLGERLAHAARRHEPLTTTDANRVLQSLLSLRILDPAVGTGAFLLAALLDLEAMALHALQFLPDVHRNRRQLREHWITHALHGIDIQRSAVWLAELRLWLSVTAVSGNAPQDATPLPNLEHRLRVGNALITPTWSTIPHASPLLREAKAALKDALHAFPTMRGEARAGCLQQIRALESTITTQSLSTQIDALSREREAQLALHPSLQRPKPPSAEEKALIHAFNAHKSNDYLRAFDPKLHFADVMDDGGFDIIIGNPPWGQLSHQDTHTQQQLRSRYTVLQSAGGRQASPDISVTFFEAYTPLLSPHGRLAFLFPSKALRAGWGRAWREWAQRDAQIEGLEELSTDSNHGFHASVYPAICVARRARPQEPLHTHPALRRARAPQTLDMPGFSPLSHHFRPRYGIKTGCNAAFVLDRESRLSHSVPVLRGRDIRPFTFECNKRLLFTHDKHTGAVLRTLAPDAGAHLTAFEGALRHRSDLRDNMPWWTLFRVRPELLGWRVVWRDVAQKIEAAVLPPLACGGPVNLNSTYAVAVANHEDARALCAWLNTPAATRILRPHAQRARGQYFRFDARLMAQLPIPDALFEAGSETRERALGVVRSMGSLPQADAWDAWCAHCAQVGERPVSS